MRFCSTAKIIKICFSSIRIFEKDGFDSWLYLPMHEFLCNITTLRVMLFIKIALIFYAKDNASAETL